MRCQHLFYGLSNLSHYLRQLHVDKHRSSLIKTSHLKFNFNWKINLTSIYAQSMWPENEQVSLTVIIEWIIISLIQPLLCLSNCILNTFASAFREWISSIFRVHIILLHINYTVCRKWSRLLINYDAKSRSVCFSIAWKTCLQVATFAITRSSVCTRHWIIDTVIPSSKWS